MSHLDAVNPTANATLIPNWSGYSTHYTEQVSLVEQLQTTLDVEQQLEIYLSAISEALKVVGLELDTFHGKFSSGNVTSGNANSKEQLALPIRIHDQLMGRITYFSQKPVTDILLATLSNFQKRLVFPLRNALAFWQLQQLALKDTLTGVGNRASYNESIERSVLQAKRHNSSFILMLLDLDNFKQANDNFGHQIGDDILVEFVALANNCLRGSDQIFRFGGDEFAILLEDDNLLAANAVASRLSRSVEASKISLEFGVSVSAGCTLFDKSDTELTMFARADKALYKAKANGKNCLKCA